MRKLIMTMAAVAAFGVAVPTIAATPASAETIIIKKGGHHDGWRRAHNRSERVVIVKKRGHGHYRHGRGHGHGHRHHHIDRY